MSDFFKAGDGSLSKFNEASLKILRINAIQSTINECNVNLLGINLEVGKYNYEVKFDCINSLFVEISAQLSDKEIDSVQKLRKNIKKLMKTKPVHDNVKNMVTHEINKKVNASNWDTIEELLFDYDILIKRYMKKHNISLPDDDDPALAGYR